MNYNDYYDPYAYAQSAQMGLRPRSGVAGAVPQRIRYDTIFIYPDNLNGALLLIQQAFAGETEDRMFYNYLIEHAPSTEDTQIISTIRDDEIGHFNMFHQIYYALTGRLAPQMPAEEFTPPSSYCDGLKHALIGEQNAVRKYRKILYAMQNPIHINMLTDIITDEIRHGILYNYLFAKNGCKE